MDISEQFKLMLDRAMLSEPQAFQTFGEKANVQDQLQEMAGEKHPLSLVFNLKRWSEMNYDYVDDFTSMEQLWLAFVMKEKFNRLWNGEEWVEP